MDNDIIESVLEKVKWDGISIQQDPDGKNVLILVCESKENADIFYNLLESVKYQLTKIFYPDTGVYGLLITFTNTKYTIGCDTKKTVENYPSIKLINEGQIDYMTTGALVEYNESDEAVYLYNKRCSLFDRIHLN